MPKKITKIAPTSQQSTPISMPIHKRRRVAAYARVSTDQEEQLTSYEAQKDYYTQYIKSRIDWEFVGVYADEGITGTSTKHRVEFKRMIADALEGKIDLIVTKSVSRFARNTVDSLTTIRELKEHDVEVYFEKENIWTFDGKGELLLTIMSSLAQEESRSISENCTWGQRKRFADGRASVAFGQFLGYDRGPNGEFVINNEQAKVVKRIFALFLDGYTPNHIARILTADHVPTPGGKTKWVCGTVQRILGNEKYKGDALLQKSFTVDFLTKKKKANEGELPQYYIKDNHPAIIDEDTFDAVQALIAERRMNNKNGLRQVSSHAFSNRIFCGECGAPLIPVIEHSNDIYRKVVWRCKNRYNKESDCTGPRIQEKEVCRLFVEVANEQIVNQKELLEDFEKLQKELFDTKKLRKKAKKVEERMEALAADANALIHAQAVHPIDPAEYDRQYNAVYAEYNKQEEEYHKIKREIGSLSRQATAFKEFMKTIKDRKILEEYDDKLFRAMVERIVLFKDKRLVFHLKNGAEIEKACR